MKKLGEICGFVGGMQPPKHTFRYSPAPDYVRLVQIQDFRRNDVSVYIPEKEAKRHFKKNDVMIGRYGPPVFQILRGLEGAYNVALMKCVPAPILNEDFLFYLLQAPFIQTPVIKESQRSAGQSGVQREFLEALMAPVPPLPEQKRIAAQLATQLEAVAQAKQAATAQLKAIEALPAALLRETLNSHV